MPSNLSEATRAQYEEWLGHPTTRALQHFLRAQRQALAEQWLNGSFTAETVEKTAMLTANAVGQGEVLTLLIDLEPEQFLLEQE